jgi:hypothetical protein
MKIKEVIERECCDERKHDLKPYGGTVERVAMSATYYFCIHCGQIWVDGTRRDGAGGTEIYLRKVAIRDTV